MTLTDLTLIKGVGPNTGKNLTEAGFTTVAEIAGAELEALAGVHGIGPSRAADLQTAARAAVDAVVVSPAAGSAQEKKGKAGKTKKAKKAKEAKKPKGDKKTAGKKKVKAEKKGKGKKKGKKSK